MLEGLLSAGTAAGVILVVVVMVTLLLRKDRARALFWALAVGGVVVLEVVLKKAFERPSVGGKPGYSFPSGGAMGSVAIVAAATLLVEQRRRRLIAAVGVPIVLGYGVALVFGLWHYPSDVVAGWSLAIAWVTCVWLAFRPMPGFR